MDRDRGRNDSAKVKDRWSFGVGLLGGTKSGRVACLSRGQRGQTEGDEGGMSRDGGGGPGSKRYLEGTSGTIEECR